MIEDAVLLLVAGVMLFVDDDQAEVSERQEQRRAGADDDLRFADAAALPDAARGCGADAGMPFSGAAPKRASKRATNCAVSAISGIRTRVWRPCSSAAAIASR